MLNTNITLYLLYARMKIDNWWWLYSCLHVRHCIFDNEKDCFVFKVQVCEDEYSFPITDLATAMLLVVVLWCSRWRFVLSFFFVWLSKWLSIPLICRTLLYELSRPNSLVSTSLNRTRQVAIHRIENCQCERAFIKILVTLKPWQWEIDVLILDLVVTYFFN